MGCVGCWVPILITPCSSSSSQELNKKRSSLVKFSRQGNYVRDLTVRLSLAATKPLALPCSNGDMFSFHLTNDQLSLNQTVGIHLTSAMNPSGELSYCMNLSSCAQKSLVGYWMGPDIDDGWGFVEASVNKII